MAKVTSLLDKILKTTKNTTATKSSNSSKTVQSGSSSSGSVVKGQTTSSGTSTQKVKTAGPATTVIKQGVISPGKTSTNVPKTPTAGAPKTAAPKSNVPTTAKAKAKAKAGAGGGSFDAMISRWNELKGTTSVDSFLFNYNKNHGTNFSSDDVGAGDLNSQLQDQLDLLDADYAAQQDFINQDSSLDDEQRAIALQELETQLSYARQQFELVRQQSQSDIAEAQRQLPITIRDIADSYAAQGAFYSGRRGEAQDEATKQTQLAVQAMERTFRGEELSQEERDALGALQRGEITLAGKRDDLQTAMDHWNETQGYQSSKLDLETRFKEALQTLQENSAKAAKEAKAGHLSETQLGTMFGAGTLTEKDYKAALQGLGYSAKEAGQVVSTSKVLNAQEAAAQASKGGTKSLSDITDMARQRIIDEKTFTKEAVSRGYSSNYAKAAFLTATSKPPVGAKSSSSGGTSGTITNSELDDGYHKGAVTMDQYVAELKRRGASSGEIAAQVKLHAPTKGGEVNPKDEAVTVAGRTISPYVAQAMGDPTKWFNTGTNYPDYIEIRDDMLRWQSEHGRRPSTKEFVEYEKQLLRAAHPGYSTKTVDTRIATYGQFISQAIYRYYYGGATKYPYKPGSGNSPYGPQKN